MRTENHTAGKTFSTLSAVFLAVAYFFVVVPIGLSAPNVPDVIVAADGSGQYRSIQEAISAAPLSNGSTDQRWLIFVKAGTYRERVYVQRERGNLLIRGEDATTTIITFDLHAKLPGPDGQPIGTFRTPTVQVDGDGIICENLTIANTAGPVAQALALRVDGDGVVFRNCRFLGWQDTLLVNRGRHYFENCYIEGHVDFIFGGATAFFERCHIHCLRDGYITAASTPAGAAHGLVFADCRITGADGVKTYLGRPWRNFAQTVFIRTEMSAVVRSEGWHNWRKSDAESTIRYAEFGNTGPGATFLTRVPWSHQLTENEAKSMTVAAVLGGTDHWNPVVKVDLLPSASSNVPASIHWKEILKQHSAWYATVEARVVAENVLLYQFASGGWPKNREMTLPPAAEAAGRNLAVPDDEQLATIDNGATHTQIRYLARVNTAQPDERYRAAMVRGIDYLLAAQYPNGGWPQFYPVRAGYYSHITFNDDAMAEVVELLRDVARTEKTFDWIDEARRSRASAAVRRGIDCILQCQVVVNGERTVWCAQHDEKTFAPAPARNFEPVSLSGYESVGIVRCLMGEPNPTPPIIAAVEAAVKWFGQTRISGLRLERVPAPALPHGADQRVVVDSAAPPLWARFYEIGMNRPIFAGRDSIIRFSLAEIEPERRAGYNYYTEAPARLLAMDYPHWTNRVVPATPPINSPASVTTLR